MGQLLLEMGAEGLKTTTKRKVSQKWLNHLAPKKPKNEQEAYLKTTRRRKLLVKIGARLFKRIEEAALEEEAAQKKSKALAHSLRGSYRLKDILAFLKLPKSTYVLAKALESCPERC